MINSWSLTDTTSHLFGSRVVPFGAYVVFPTNDSLLVIDPADGTRKGEMRIPSGTRMTPALWKGKVLVVDQQGALLIFDPGQSKPVAAIETGAIQPVALSVLVHGDTAVFSDRKGTVIAVDLVARKVLWRRGLDGQAVSVFDDLACNGKAVFVYASSDIHALSLADGSPWFSTISGATSPPLCTGDALYHGAGGGLVVRDAATGHPRGGVKIPGEVITTRPASVDGRIVAGTRSGKLLVMNP